MIVYLLFGFISAEHSRMPSAGMAGVEFGADVAASGGPVGKDVQRVATHRGGVEVAVGLQC